MIAEIRVAHATPVSAINFLPTRRREGDVLFSSAGL